MLYKELKALVKGLLIGDNVYPKDEDVQLMLLKDAYDKVAMQADSLKLFTKNKDNAIVRVGLAGMFVRMPTLPTNPTDTLDIDDELCYVVARYIAYEISKNKKTTLAKDAADRLADYNSKVKTYLATLTIEEKLALFGKEGADTLINREPYYVV